jgi:hypothetical protein
MSKRIEVVSNVATIIVAVLLSFVLVREFVLPRPHPAPGAAGVAVGSNLQRALPGVSWSKNGETLVFALSTQCHFCTESAPFFQRIGKQIPLTVSMLAVLPQSKPDAQRYLTKMGVPIKDVRQANLTSIGVSGTPTLLVVDDAGIVTHVWVGKPLRNQESEILSTLAELGDKQSAPAREQPHCQGT